MKSLFLTNEYPPNIYGGAGVHVDYLSRALAERITVDVRCFGDQDEARDRLLIKGHSIPPALLDPTPKPLRSPIGTLARCVSFNATPTDADVVHCHTWYSHFGGIAAKLLYGPKLVVTTHSLEPLRPWKREHLGRGYDFSSWVERTAIELADAVIAVSEETRADVLRHFDVPEERIVVIPNGIDLDEYRKVEEHDELARHGVPTDRPYLLFVGRVTRQKGIVHLLAAVERLPSEIPVVLCAGQPDTDEIAAEMNQLVSRIRSRRGNLYWIEEMVSRRAAIQLYSHARVFCCPSIYEPFGIINLEAMACDTAVVASAVGGIKEVVVDGETGRLVHFPQQDRAPFEPVDPETFAGDLAAAVEEVFGDEALAARMGAAGRRRVEERYSWTAVAEQVIALYRRIIDGGEARP